MDLAELAGNLAAVLGPAGEIPDLFRQTWVAIEGDAGETFGKIKDILRGVNFEEIIWMDFDSAWARVAETADQVWEQVSDFAARASFRMVRAIDQAWEKLQEPLAKGADWLQGVLVKLEVLEEGTASWGDAIRSVTDVGDKLFRNLAYGFGYVEGLLRKVGGYFGEYLLAPFVNGLGVVMEFVGEMSRGVRQILKEEIGLSDAMADRMLGPLTRLDAMAERVGKKLKDQVGGIVAASKDLQVADPGAFANLRAGGWDAFKDRGKQQVESREFMEGIATAFGERLAGGLAWINDAGLFQPFKETKPLAPETVKAFLKDTNETNNLIARAQAAGVAPVQERIAALQAAGLLEQKENNKLMRALLDALKDAPVLGALQ